MLYFPAKLNLSKISTFLYTNQQLSCNMLRKMDLKSNQFFDSLMPFTINLLLTLPVGQYPNDFRVVGLRMKPIKGLRGNWVNVIVSIDRLHTEVY